MSALIRKSEMSDKSGQPVSLGAERMTKSLAVGPSPLKIFGNAKKKVRDIYADISGYISEARQFVSGMDDERVVTEAEKSQVTGYTGKVTAIREVLSRDHMKVVFFGRTSNGKSTTINTMLRSKILPSGIGHTTNCFVQVEGSDSAEGYVLLEGSDEKHNVHSLKDLANALSSMKLDPNSLIRICWPKNKCGLLRDDVVLVDSPGIDVSPDLDSWIDKFCLDADVFVLVANAESTLMQTEKNFFLKVSDRLSKPTVFILNNRWDASANEPEMMEEVRAQHMERNIEFLCRELKVVSAKEAADRIFFVSAKESLHQRLVETGASTTPCPQLEGFQSRLFAFANFERQFEECISRSAVKTKFAQHAQKAKLISIELRTIMDNVLERANTIRDSLLTSRQSALTRLTQLDKKLTEIQGEIERTIRSVSDDTRRKVSEALNDEIRRLAVLVAEFDRPFHPDPLVIDVYKRELNDHVEKGLSRNIESRCSTTLDELVSLTEQKMTDRLLMMLPVNQQQAAHSHLPTQPSFSVEYRLDAKSLCADFTEDIAFRFSLSPAALLQRYMRKGLSISALFQMNQTEERVLGTVPPPRVVSQPSQALAPAPPEDDLAVAILRLAPTLASTSTVTVVVVAGAVSRAVGWKVFAVIGGIYGALYCYERLMWSNRAKERAFKAQYVRYAGERLKMVVDMTSANASHQVQKHLSSTYSHVEHEVRQARSQLANEIETIDASLTKLNETASRAKTLRNKAGWLDNECNVFITQFIEYS